MTDAQFLMSYGYLPPRLAKAGGGEGSRGGRVVGHDKSGKPIYESAGRKPYPGEEAHTMKKLPEAQRKKTFIPPEGTSPHYSDPPALKAYKVLMREFKRRGEDFVGHITYDPKVNGIKTLTDEGAQMVDQIVADMQAKAVPAVPPKG